MFICFSVGSRSERSTVYSRVDKRDKPENTNVVTLVSLVSPSFRGAQELVLSVAWLKSVPSHLTKSRPVFVPVNIQSPEWLKSVPSHLTNSRPVPVPDNIQSPEWLEVRPVPPDQVPSRLRPRQHPVP